MMRRAERKTETSKNDYENERKRKKGKRRPKTS